MQPVLMSVREVAALTGIAPENVRYNIDTGIWKFGRSYIKPGNRHKTYEIRRAAFERWARGE